MKTRHMFIAVAAFTTLAACTKEFTEQQGSENSLKISVTATAENFANVADSKTHIDGTNTIIWDENEQMTIFLVNNGTAEDATSNDFIGAGDTEAMFSFSFSSVPETGPYTYGGIYPSSADKGLAISNGSNTTNDKVELPAIQSATATSYDPAAYIMVAKPETFETIQTEWIASYRRATALNKMTLTNVGEDIKSVEITVPEGKYLAGRRYIDIATGESGEIYYDETNKVTVNYASTALPHTAADVWFTSWEVQVAEGENVTVKVTTESKIYTKTISARAEGIKFLENYLNTITIDMSDAEIEEIEETPGIQEGEYLIAAYYNGSWAILTPENPSDYFTAAPTSVSTSIADINCTYFYGITDVESNVWTIEKSGNGYSICNGTAYIEISDDKAKIASSPVALSITENEDGTYFIEEIGATSKRSLQYNNDNSRFKPYLKSSTNQYPAPVLIPWVENTAPVIIVYEQEKTVGHDAESVTFEYTTSNIDGDISATEVSDADNIVSAVSIADGTVSVTLVPNTEEKAKTAEIELSYTGAESVILKITQRALPAAGTKYYVKVTEEPADWSGQYLIVYENGNNSIAFDGSLTSGFGNSGNHKSVTVEDDMILSTEETDNISFTIAQISGGYSIQSHSGYYIYNPESGYNQVEGSMTETGLNTISIEDNSCKIESTTTVLRYNTTGMFRYYKSASYKSQKPIQLYKLQ